MDNSFIKLVPWILVACIFQIPTTGFGQEPFPEKFSLSDNPKLRKIADAYTKNYGNLNNFYVLMNGHYLSKGYSVDYRDISEIYFKDWNVRDDLIFPTQNFYSTIIDKNGEFTFF